MYERIRGVLEEVQSDGVIIQSDPFSYKVFTSLRTIEQLPRQGEEVLLFLYPSFKENDILLYGFDSEEDKEIFKDLISVNKVGPRTAMSLLSLYSPDDIVTIIADGRVKDLTRATGLGKKGAELIIATLKDKYKNKVVAPSKGSGLERIQLEDQVFSDAVSALTNLGYSWEVASEAVRHVYQEEVTLEDTIKQALVALSEIG